MDTVRFEFNGGMADNHEMNFYEAGRFQYGAARFIYTLEKFRKEGVIAARLTTKVDTDIRIRAPERGSFIQDVLLLSAPLLAESTIQCSFQALFSYVWGLLLPQSRAADVAVELAKQEVAREKQHTKQEKERTKQMQIMADVAQTSNATSQQALQVLEHAVVKGLTIANEHFRLSKDDIKNLRNEAQAATEREKIIRENQEQLSKIDPQTERRLVGQLRKSIHEMALPLRSSASELTISQTGNSSQGRVAHLNRDTAKSITRESEDGEISLIRGSIKAFDVENGYGKFRYDELKRPISFRVPSASKNVLKDRILDAMKQEDVLIGAYYVRDSFGNPVSLILDNIHDDEALDQMGLTE